jgi:hypothetical protein
LRAAGERMKLIEQSELNSLSMNMAIVDVTHYRNVFFFVLFFIFFFIFGVLNN